MVQGEADVYLEQPSPPPVLRPDYKLLVSATLPCTPHDFFRAVLADDSHCMEDFMEGEGNRCVCVLGHGGLWHGSHFMEEEGNRCVCVCVCWAMGTCGMAHTAWRASWRGRGTGVCVCVCVLGHGGLWHGSHCMEDFMEGEGKRCVCVCVGPWGPVTWLTLHGGGGKQGAGQGARATGGWGCGGRRGGGAV